MHCDGVSFVDNSTIFCHLKNTYIDWLIFYNFCIDLYEISEPGGYLNQFCKNFNNTYS